MPLPKNKNIARGALLVFAFAAPAHADNEDAIARCARIAAVGDRILCLENALRQSSHEAESPVVKATPPNETTSIEVAPVIKTVASEAPLANAEDVPPTIENFGLKEKRAPDAANTVQVTVTSVRKNLTDRLIFQTEDGHLWLQTDQRSVRYRDVPFDAEIRAASMGSFFLKPVAGGVSVRVRREK